MRTSATVVVAGMLLAASATTGWAQGAKVIVSREENKPKTVEVKAGQEVKWINQSGGTAHVWFSGHDAIRFYVGNDSRVKFDKPGTYEYTVHVTGTKTHAHTGTVVVK